MTQKQMDREIEKAYYKLAQGLVISIMDIPKVFRDSRKFILEGAAVDQAVRVAILSYCGSSGEELVQRDEAWKAAQLAQIRKEAR